MTQELMVREEMNLSDTLKLGDVLCKSGFFSDAKQQAQAVVKVLAGRELGIGPVASMTGIHIVQGKPTIGANIIAALVKADPRYDYRIASHTDDACDVAFFENGKEVGHSTFTMDDAKKAGLVSNPTWQKYPRNMLFSRAMSNGARWYCPDVFSGIIAYTPEEMGAEVDGDGDVIDVTPTAVNPKATSKPVGLGWTPSAPLGQPEPATATNGKIKRPLTAEQVRNAVRKKAGWDGDSRLDAGPASEKQMGAVAGMLEASLDGMPRAQKASARHDILEYLLGVRTTSKLTVAEASAIIDWLKDADAEGWEPNEWATAEAAQVLAAFAVGAGQAELDLPY